MIFRRNSALPLDRSDQMIAETSAFLTWALSGEIQLPRIPTRRIDRGGFTELLKSPAARAAVYCWWSRALDAFDRVRDRS